MDHKEVQFIFKTITKLNIIIITYIKYLEIISKIIGPKMEDQFIYIIQMETLIITNLIIIVHNNMEVQ